MSTLICSKFRQCPCPIITCDYRRCQDYPEKYYNKTPRHLRFAFCQDARNLQPLLFFTSILLRRRKLEPNGASQRLHQECSYPSKCIKTQTPRLRRTYQGRKRFSTPTAPFPASSHQRIWPCLQLVGPSQAIRVIE
jgi:hypothetical protein